VRLVDHDKHRPALVPSALQVAQNRTGDK